MAGRLIPCLLAMLALLGSFQVGVAGDAEEEASPYALYLPGTAPENVVAVRVVGLEDGRIVPVAGARLTGWSEEAGEWIARPAQLLIEGFTDEHGFANLAWPDEGDEPFHWLAEAPGKTVRIWHPASYPESVHLARGAPYAVRVLSPLGAPLASARLEYYIYGCPHSPAARVGTTDADGLVVFDGLPVPEEENPDPHNDWGQFWVTADGVASRRHDARARRTDGQPVTILTEPGRTVEGRVLDEHGESFPGVVVRGRNYPRGPVTTTDAEGRFRLDGVGVDESVAFYDPSNRLGSDAHAVVADFESDVPIRLTLRKGRASALGDGEPWVTVAVETRWGPTAQDPLPADGVPIRLVRLSDGLLVAGETGGIEPGRLRELAPPGRYRVIVGGGFSPAVRQAREVDLPAEEPRFVLEKAARLELEGLDPDGPEWVGLRLTGETASEVGEPDRTVWLPPDAPAVVHLERGRLVLLPVGPSVKGVRRAIASPSEPAQVRLRVQSANPATLANEAEVAWADDHLWELETEEKDGIWTLTTWERGRLRIRAEARGFQHRVIEVHIGPEDHVVDLGDLVLHPRERLVPRFLHADGTVPADLSLEWGVRGREGNELALTDGSFELDLGPRPVLAVLRGEGIYPLQLRLSTESPGEIRLPGGRLELHVHDEAGGALDFVAYVNHMRLVGKGGACTLRGLPGGTHTVIVGARGHLGVVRKVEPPEDGLQTLELTLPRR